MPSLEQEIRPPSTPGEADQRCSPRYACCRGRVLRLAVRPLFGSWLAVPVDVSADGMGLLVEAPLEEGTVLALELFGPEGLEGARLAQVCHSGPGPLPHDAPWLPRPSSPVRFLRWFFGLPEPAPPGQAWLIGCEFHRPLTDAEMDELLARLNPYARRGCGDRAQG
jgi:hypothetical protein